jgi:DNA-binding transcriptional LysR family regulator
LEEELGAPLFERTARGVRLLPAGEVFLRHARGILHAVDAAVADVRRKS